MHFATTYYLYLLLIIPVFALLFVFLGKWKRKTYQKFGDTSVIMQLMPEVSDVKPLIKFIIRMLALALLIFAIARPQTGAKLVKAKHKGVELMILLDVSNSMLAQDIKPSRLERAKLAIQKLMDQLDNDKLGIIVFAGKPYVQLPITTDYAAGKLFLSTVSTEMVPAQGTAIGAAIDMALTSFNFSDKTKNKAIIVISDGENHEDDAVTSTKAAVEKGVYVHTIGIGSTEGSPIPITGGSGSTYKQDGEGKTIMTKLNETILREISTSGKGVYVHATTADVGLTMIMDEIDKMEKKEYDEKIYSDYEDQFQYFLAFAIVFMLWELFIFERRSKWYKKLDLFGEIKNGKRKTPQGISSYGKTKMNKVFFILSLSIIFLAGCGGSENKHIRDGNSSYQDSSYSEAVSAYKKALEANPESQIAKFNLADAYYKLMQYKEAGELLKKLIPLAESDSAKLLQIYYNFGNILLASSFDCTSKNATLTDNINNQQSLIDSQSNIVAKVNLGVALDSMITIHDSILSAKDTLLMTSIEAYKKALRYDCHDMDAKYNLIYAMKFLPKNLSSNSSKQEKTEPTEFAIKLKKQADSLVSLFKFSDAYDLMSNGLEKDTTVKTYNDFIKKLKDVKDIL